MYILKLGRISLHKVYIKHFNISFPTRLNLIYVTKHSYGHINNAFLFAHQVNLKLKKMVQIWSLLVHLYLLLTTHFYDRQI